MATIEGETATTSEGIVESAVTADDDNDNDKEEDIGNDDNDNDNNDGIVPTKTKAQQQPATNNPPGLPVSTAIEFEPPLACVRRILKKTLPSSTNVGKDASAAFARACGIFIIYITACANDFARENRRQTITANDVLAAIKELEFDEFTPELTEFLDSYRSTEKDKRDAKAAAVAAKANTTTMTTITTTPTSSPGGGGDADDDDYQGQGSGNNPKKKKRKLNNGDDDAYADVDDNNDDDVDDDDDDADGDDDADDDDDGGAGGGGDDAN